ncbi:MAG TPA: SGNH/GDSL hydrolase family protein [Tepidisphaeraceae bacterium]|jgi:hypothetical protein|nr:SGNH/GDSL hydrolase family protein [Tepidisphaeraceae bacterium]
MPAIHNNATRPAFNAMRANRVDVVMLSDSNGLFGGHGWDHGWQHALNLKYSLYATGSMYQNENMSSGSGVGFNAQVMQTGNSLLSLPSTALTGTGSITANGFTLAGSGTMFTTELSVGQIVRVGSGSFGRIVSITNDTTATVALAWGGSLSGQALLKYAKPPAELYQYIDLGNVSDVGLHPINYFYVEAGTTFSAGQNGVILASTSPLDVSGPLIARWRYGTFNGGAGSFRPGFRLESSPFTVLAVHGSGAISTNTGAVGMATAEVSLAAANREGLNLGVRWRLDGQAHAVGPFFGLSTRVYRSDRTAGASLHTLDFKGGKSTRTLALDVQSASDAMLTEYFGEVRALQASQSKRHVVIVINSGVNDRNETGASVGPTPNATGDSPAAYADNLQAIINRVRAIWTLNGWPLSELYTLVMPSHAISAPDDAEVITYRTAAQGVADANPQTDVVDLSQLADFTVMRANGWYAGTGDRNHLTQIGYEGLSVRIIDALSADLTYADLAVQSDLDTLLTRIPGVVQPQTGDAYAKAVEAKDSADAAARPGDAMTLTAAAWHTGGEIIEGHLLDEGDGQMLVNMLVGAIGNSNVDELSLVAAIRADIERTGGTLALTYTAAEGARTIASNTFDAVGEIDLTGLAMETTAEAARVAAVDAKAAADGIDAAPDLRGPGASLVTIPLTVDGAPLADADVWITSDAAGANVIAGTLQTDSAGEATFLLDAGLTYYVWAQRDGVNAIRGHSFVAVED